MSIKNNLLTIIIGGETLSYSDGEIINIEKKLGNRHIEELQKVTESNRTFRY